MRINPKAKLTWALALLMISSTLSHTAHAQRKEAILWAAEAGPEYTAIGGNYDSLFLWSNQIPKPNLRLAIPSTITNLKWHPKGNLLAISTQVEPVPVGVLILNIETMKLDTLPGISDTGARALGWHPSGEYLAVGDNEGLLHLYNKEQELLKTIKTGLRSITGLDWHPKKNLITMVSGKLGQYNMDTDQMRTWESRKEEMLMLAIAWHPSGEFFATGDYGDYRTKQPALLQYWNEEGSLIRSVEGSKAEYRNISWTADGNALATVSEAFRLWDTSGNQISALPFDNLLWGLSFDHKHGQWIATDNTGQVFMISKDGTKKVIKITPFGGGD